MLFGCCHCGELSSSSSSSEGSSSSGIDTITRTTCIPNEHRCLNDTAPLVFNFNVATVPGTKFQCHVNYVGNFSVFLNTLNPTICWNYESAEFAKKLSSLNLPCTDLVSARRWSIGIFSVTPGPKTKIILGCQIENGGFLNNLARWEYTAGSININCVSSFTLTKTTTDTTGYPFPTSVVITPI